MILTLAISAGATVPCPCLGSRFEVVASPCPLYIRAGNSVPFSPYGQQTGEVVPSGFRLLEIQNTSAADIVAQIFVGDGEFIDNRQLPSPSQPNVFFPTKNTQASGTFFPITDLSGTIVTDQAGVTWYAIQRLSLNFSVIAENQATFGLFRPGTTVNAIASFTGLYSAGQLSVVNGSLPVRGDFNAQPVGLAAPMGCNVWEIYQALPLNPQQ